MTALHENVAELLSHGSGDAPHELLRFATAGSVDDGKSTLVGRLLHDTKSVLADTLAAVERASLAKGFDGAGGVLARMPLHAAVGHEQREVLAQPRRDHLDPSACFEQTSGASRRDRTAAHHEGAASGEVDEDRVGRRCHEVPSPRERRRRFSSGPKSPASTPSTPTTARVALQLVSLTPGAAKITRCIAPTM